MAEQTAISWAEATMNPWIGCSRVSPACDGCYAANLAKTRMAGRVVWGEPGAGAGTRDRTSEENRRKPLSWNRNPLRLKPPEGTKPFIFCASLADMFDNEVPSDWRAELFAVIHATPNLQWLLLTKRPQLIVRQWQANGDVRGWPANAAIGTTVEDRARLVNLQHLQNAADELRDVYGQGPTFTFGSFGPLLEDLEDISPWLYHSGMTSTPLGWVIVEGETDQGDHKARPTHADWVRSLRDQAAAADVPFQFKQWGEWLPGEVYSKGDQGGFARHQDGSDGRWRGHADHWWSGDTFGGVISTKVGKKHSGRLLDGVEHMARPLVLA